MAQAEIHVCVVGCWEPSEVSGALRLPALAPKPPGCHKGVKGQGAGNLPAYSYLLANIGNRCRGYVAHELLIRTCKVAK